MKSTVILIFTLSVVMSCNAQQYNWLVGTWKLKNKNVYEVWSLEQNQLKGISYKISAKGDTTITEKLSLISKDGSYYYVSDVPHNKQPIAFKIGKTEEFQFVAENREHDFPKLIRYRYLASGGKHQIDAAIEGDGKVIPYSFEKVE